MLPALSEMARGRGLLLDTNLLILYLIGCVNRNRIGRFKRTQSYSQQDFDRLVMILSQTKHWVTTPHILTQVSDLVKLENPEFGVFLRLFRTWVTETSESITPANELISHRMFYRVGLADAAITVVAERGILVLTDDFDLYISLAERALPVINFNHLRSQFRL